MAGMATATFPGTFTPISFGTTLGPVTSWSIQWRVPECSIRFGQTVPIGTLRWTTMSPPLEGNCGDEDLDVRLFDLSPRGPFADRIAQCDVLDGLPVDRADYIIVDPPYCGVVNGQYSDLPNDLGNMEPGEWIGAIRTIAVRFAAVQAGGGRCTVVVPNHRVLRTGERLLFPEIVRRAFAQAGYVLQRRGVRIAADSTDSEPTDGDSQQPGKVGARPSGRHGRSSNVREGFVT